MRLLETIPADVSTPVLVRSALNVPVAEGSVANAYRLRRAVPTLRLLSERGARVIVISHLGEKGIETLAPVAETLSTLLPRVRFFSETIGPRAREAVRTMLPGEILVLENLRRNPGEATNDPAFVKELASLADVFVEDSFDTCHRPHASIVGVPKLLPAYAGALLAEEIAALSGARMPSDPSLAVIGGAKFATKEPVLTTLLSRYNHVAIGGALANDFVAALGHSVGKSLVSSTDMAPVRALLQHPRLVLPTDVIVSTSASKSAARIAAVTDVHADESILDIGPTSAARIAGLAKSAKHILWNGPLGNYENGFVDATDTLARAIAASGAHSVVGGGDTIASIEKLGLFSQFSFVSTGGGAMLDYLAKGTLPGIDALG